MTRRLKCLLILGAAVTVIAVAGGLTGTVRGGHGERDGGRDDRPVKGAQAEEAGAAALKATGGGRVLEVEADGDPGSGASDGRKRDDADSATDSGEGGPDNERDLAYEVTVEQPDGKLVEVQLPKGPLGPQDNKR
jgi:hypothetical protein